MLNCLGNAHEMERIVKQCHGHDFVHLFRDSTVGVISREIAMENFLSAICEKYSEQIEMHAVASDGQRTFARARSELDDKFISDPR